MSELEKALRAVLRGRGKMAQLIAAIHYAALEGHTLGRLNPYPDGLPHGEMERVTDSAEAVVVRLLCKKKVLDYDR